MDKPIKGKLLSEIPKKARQFLHPHTGITCVVPHSYVFDSGLTKRFFDWKKGDRDRLGYVIIENDKYWKIHSVIKS